MKNYPIWKTFIVFIVVVLAIIFSIPSFLYKEDTKNWYFDNKVNLGLDLQGGQEFLLAPKIESWLINEFSNYTNSNAKKDLFEALENCDNLKSLSVLTNEQLENIIKRSCTSKAKIVALD